MKAIFKKTGTILLGTIAALSFAACSESFLDDINKDVNHPVDVDSKFIIPDIVLRTAQNVVGGDINTYSGIFLEHWAGTHGQLWQADSRDGYERVASTYNDSWVFLYKIMMDAKTVIGKTEEGAVEGENTLARAVAEIMLAYNAAVATDLFGDTPYKEAGDYINFATPKLDKQEDIYKDVMRLLDDAIVLLGDTLGWASNTLNSYDLMYNGNAEKWQKFAYGLKARYKMRLIYRSTDKAADYQKILDYISKSFAGADEQASINVYDGTNQNPLFDLEWSRDAISSSLSLYNKLMARSDPRVNRAYLHSRDWIYLDSAAVRDYLPKNGEQTSESQYLFAYDYSMYAEIASVHLLSYHELLFLKAEALASLNQVDSAKVILEDAIVASMANFEANLAAALNSPTLFDEGGIEGPADETIPFEEIDSCFNNFVVPLFDADPIKEIMLQKYFAFWGANGESTECYNDVRRMMALGKDIYDFANPKPDRFPLRAPYGADDASANPNVRDAYGNGFYIYSEPVWWAGGTR
ncbi:MAG: SusD/RagB family nutrient-binding outer membrane lipoprotein [Bacteroidaceae bacterium]|nr:SusD/RagB family nutrient-binding outer membrane lipoprotein [Bacteroidaceae bacterium]MBP5347956.1 SusD/RagB family nutrient-binding outer membrane lipoprotein [Bacteroidaceae bacterium]